MPKPNRTAALVVTALAALTLAGAACGADASGDDPPKTRGRIVADACHAAYGELQARNPNDYNYEGVGSLAYLVAFTADYCGGVR